MKFKELFEDKLDEGFGIKYGNWQDWDFEKLPKKWKTEIGYIGSPIKTYFYADQFRVDIDVDRGGLYISDLAKIKNFKGIEILDKNTLTVFFIR